MRVKHSFRFSLMLVCLILSVVTALAACTGAAPASAPGGAGNASAPSAASPAAAQPSKPEGTLTVALGSFSTDQTDPILSDGVARNTIAAMFDPLISANPDGSMAPGVAEKWEWAADGKSWTFHLRKGMAFHNGWGEVTADDVKYSLERTMSKDSKTPQAGSLRSTITGIDVVDPYTVRVNTKGPVVDLPFMLSILSSHDSLVVSKKYIEEKGVDEFRRNPVGSGPYKFVSHVASTSYEFEAVTDPAVFKNHFRPMPAFQKLKILMVPEDATRVAMLKTGEADMIETSPESKADLEKGGAKVVSVPFAAQLNVIVWTTWRTPNLPTAKLKVRQALNSAMNRDEIVKSMLMGEGSAKVLPTRVFPFSQDVDMKYWQDYGDQTYKYDPQKAKQLLADAGYPNGFDLKFWAYEQMGFPWLPKLAEVLAGYYRQVGIRTTIAPIDYNAHQNYTKPTPQGTELDGTVAILNSPGRPIVAPSLQYSFHSVGTATSRLLKDPEVDAAIDGALVQPDNTKRQESLKKAIQLTGDSMTSIPIVYTSSVVAVGKNIGKWTAFAGGPYLNGMSFGLATHATK